MDIPTKMKILFDLSPISPTCFSELPSIILDLYTKRMLIECLGKAFPKFVRGRFVSGQYLIGFPMLQDALSLSVNVGSSLSDKTLVFSFCIFVVYL